MEATEYSSRTLREVMLTPIQLDALEDGTPAMQVNLHLDLSSADDPDRNGPSIALHLAVPFDPKAPVKQLEGIALASAANLLARFAKEDLSTITATLQKTREADKLQPTT